MSDTVADAVVDSTRKALGPMGVCLPVSFTDTLSADALRETAHRLERSGYRAVWTNEVIGKDALVQLGMLLADTERMVFGTCIANIWARPAQTMHAAAAQLAQAYPGRLVLGIGIGYPEQAASVGREFGRPLSTMRDYPRRGRPRRTRPTPASSPPTGRRCWRWQGISPTGRCRPGCRTSSPRRRAARSDRTSCWW
nr:LLM class flavin-dependent oxidoreductase [Mycobacterium sp. E796]